MVLVFDEVDAGVGGEAADQVGRQLAELGARTTRSCASPTCRRSPPARSVHFRVEKRTAGRPHAASGSSARSPEPSGSRRSRAWRGAARRATPHAEYARELLRPRVSP